jgi:hypothetical protein
MRRPRRATHLLVLLLLVLAGARCSGGGLAPLPEGGVRVLFIGNSLTYTNDLPRTIADLAASLDEEPLVFRTVAKAGYALEDHYGEDVASKVRDGGWHFVVMQQGPSTTLANRIHLQLWTSAIDEVVVDVGARSALYEVAPGGTALASFEAVRASYRNAAEQVGGMFIPAAEAFLEAWAEDPALALYGGDQFHPSPLGTYLVALVHFEMLYGRPATDLPDVVVVDGRTLEVPAATAALLQRAAHDAVVAWGIP